MIKKLFKAFILQLLILEVRIRGTRIKLSSWRLKLKKRLPEYKVMSSMKGFRIYANDRKKISYIRMTKASSTSLIRTLLESERFRDEVDRYSAHFVTKNPAKQAEAAKLNVARDMVTFMYNKKEERPPFVFGDRFFLDDVQGIRYDQERLEWALSGHNKKSGFWRKKISLDDVNSNFIFTFVRNPFSRFVSFFQHKFIYKNGEYRYRNNDRIFSIYGVSSFDALASKISRLPDFYLEGHSWSQHIYVEYFTDLGVKIDFIGKYENLDEDFEKIRRRFDLLSLEHLNKSNSKKKDWRDYYTPKTAKMIYDRYRKDFEMFGYEDEYPKLLDYLKFRSKREA